MDLGPCGNTYERDPVAVAADATTDSDPSPPAMPSRSAPPAAASAARAPSSSPGWRTIGSIPRSRAALTSPARPARPPPDLGLMKSTGCREASARTNHQQVMTSPADRRAAPTSEWIHELNRLDAAVYAAIAATPTPAMDVALRRLSRAANYSQLWLGCSALLSACGGKRGRRAAENGLTSIALTSVVVNLVLKPLGNRRRPDRQMYAVPVTRHVSMPRSRRGPRAMPRPPLPSPVVLAPLGRRPQSPSAPLPRSSPTRVPTRACITRRTRSQEWPAGWRWRPWR